jgi:hypothetical protein
MDLALACFASVGLPKNAGSVAECVEYLANTCSTGFELLSV